MTPQLSSHSPDRRRFLTVCSAIGLGQTLLPGALFTLAAQAQTAPTSPKTGVPGLPKITPEMIDAAAAIAGITLTAEQKTMMLDGLTQQRDSAAVIRTLHIENATAPAFVFDPAPAGMVLDTVCQPLKISPTTEVGKLAATASSGLSADSDTLSFATVRELAELLKTRKLTSLELTK